jgi:hypothetical protein
MNDAAEREQMEAEGVDTEGGQYRPNDAFRAALEAKARIEQQMKDGR